VNAFLACFSLQIQAFKPFPMIAQGALGEVGQQNLADLGREEKQG
jgi:hypothetical protein